MKIWSHRREQLKVQAIKMSKLDNGIIDLVSLLNYFQIKTEMSCWGHKDCGFGYPWIDCSIDSEYKLKSLLNNDQLIVEKRCEYNMDMLKKEREYSYKFYLRVYPKCKSLIKGRKAFNRLKSKLKKEVKYNDMYSRY